jgi:hypothetical protein
LLIVSVVAVLGAGLFSCAGRTTGSQAGATSTQDDLTYSNVRAEDYVGPQTCGKCHVNNYKKWRRHPHSRMNMFADRTSVLGDFSGVSVEYAGRRAVFREDDGEYFVDYYRTAEAYQTAEEDAKQEKERTFRVIRTVGSRYEQDYVAVQIEGPEEAGHPLYVEETRLRFAWSIVAGRWLPQSYLEPTEYPGSEYLDDGSVRYDPFVPDQLPFNERCARCHNTYPYDLRFYKILTEFGRLSGFPPFPGVTPKTVRDMAQETGDEALLSSVRLPMDRFVTVGISCESCHFGGREHAEDARSTLPRFVPTHPLLANWTPPHEGARERKDVVNALCLQCHHSGEAAQDNWPDGSAGVNSMESIELASGACASEIKCTDCHNTHEAGQWAGAPDRKEHLQACVDCHEEKASTDAAEAHSLHDKDTASCLDCHMPRIVQGFETYNRSHRISMPTERRVLATGMPNACNLCHLNESLAWTRDELEAGWGKKVSLPGALRPLYGDDFERSAGRVWLEHPQASVRTVAVGAYARSGLGERALPSIVQGLSDANAYVRGRHLMGVEAIIGRSLGDDVYDLTGAPGVRAVQVRGLLERFTRR